MFSDQLPGKQLAEAIVNTQWRCYNLTASHRVQEKSEIWDTSPSAGRKPGPGKRWKWHRCNFTVCTDLYWSISYREKLTASVLSRKDCKCCSLYFYYYILLISHCSILSCIYEAALDFFCTFLACSCRVDKNMHTLLLCCCHHHKSQWPASGKSSTVPTLAVVFYKF